MDIQKEQQLKVVLLPVTEDNPENNQQNNQQNNNQQQQDTPTTYNVTFNVTNTNNQALANVVVTLTDTTDSTNTASGTTEGGSVTIAVKPGTYAVNASRDGYTASTIENVIVTSADVTVADSIVMTKD